MSAKPKFTDPWYRKPGYLYFVGAGEPLKAIKIGVTLKTGFKSRLRHLQSSNHEPLRVLGVKDFTKPGTGMRQAELLEQKLHRQFSEHQRFQSLRVGCEWFNPHQEILDYIKEHSVPCTPDLTESVAIHGSGLSNAAQQSAAEPARVARSQRS